MTGAEPTKKREADATMIELFDRGTLKCEVASCGEYAVALVQWGPRDKDVAARCGIHIAGKIAKLNRRADATIISKLKP